MPKRVKMGARMTMKAAVGPETWVREPPSGGDQAAADDGGVEAVLRRHPDRDGERHGERQRHHPDHQAGHDVGAQVGRRGSPPRRVARSAAAGSARSGVS